MVNGIESAMVMKVLSSPATQRSGRVPAVAMLVLFTTGQTASAASTRSGLSRASKQDYRDGRPPWRICRRWWQHALVRVQRHTVLKAASEGGAPLHVTLPALLSDLMLNLHERLLFQIARRPFPRSEGCNLCTPSRRRAPSRVCVFLVRVVGVRMGLRRNNRRYQVAVGMTGCDTVPIDLR